MVIELAVDPSGLLAWFGVSDDWRASSRTNGVVVGGRFAPGVPPATPCSRRALAGYGPPDVGPCAGCVPSLRRLASAVMSTLSSPFCRPEEDPVLLVESCHSALHRLLVRNAGQPLRRTWIDQPYGEEEITRLVDELMPAMEAFLQRLSEIDAELEAAYEAEVAAIEAARAAGTFAEPAVA